MTVELKASRRMTAEELTLPGAPEKFVEIIEGELIQMTPADRYHNWIAFNLSIMFRTFAERHPDLTCGTDNDGFLVERGPDTLLSPDSSLFRKRPKGPGTWMEFAPEIAVEVLSPSNSPAEMAFKRGKYHQHGTEQFWLVDPEAKILEIHFRDGRLLTASEPDVVKGEGILEGMEIRLEEIFSEP